MAKFFETSQDIVELAEDRFEDTNLPQVGVRLSIMSTTKSKEVLTIKKASPTTQYLTNKEDLVTLTVYEDAFDRLTDEYKSKLMEGAFSRVSYDTEKGSLNVDSDWVREIANMSRKYTNYFNIVETGRLVIDQIADEERQKKEEEKARKAEERAMKKKR